MDWSFTPKMKYCVLSNGLWHGIDVAWHFVRAPIVFVVMTLFINWDDLQCVSFRSHLNLVTLTGFVVSELHRGLRCEAIFTLCVCVCVWSTLRNCSCQQHYCHLGARLR